MASIYYVAIRRLDGKEVKLRPGGRGERDLIDAVGARLTATTSRKKAMQALTDVLAALKAEVEPLE